MPANCEPYIRLGETAEIKWQRVVNCLSAGYMSSDVANLVITAISQEDEEFANYDMNSLKVPEELVFSTAQDSGEVVRKIIIEPEVLEKYKPDDIDTFWQLKDVPDNCIGARTTNDPNLYGMAILEEFGFVKIGNLMVSRTVQPIWLQDTKQVLHDTVTVFPYMDELQFPKAFPCRLAVSGGFQYWGVFKLKTPSEHLHEELKCRATAVLLAVGIPKQFGQVYPFDLTNIPYQKPEEGLYY